MVPLRQCVANTEDIIWMAGTWCTPEDSRGSLLAFILRSMCRTQPQPTRAPITEGSPLCSLVSHASFLPRYWPCFGLTVGPSAPLSFKPSSYFFTEFSPVFHLTNLCTWNSSSVPMTVGSSLPAQARTPHPCRA